MSDYVSISCQAHEQLEFAVLRRQKLLLQIMDATGVYQPPLPVLPTDVATRQQAEWLTFRDDAGVEGVVRLDRIVSVVVLI